MQSKIWLKLLISSDVCHCNELGTSSGSSECLVHHFGTLTLSLCHCKEGYSGMYCHICASGYYRLGPNMPCYKCPCGPLKSNGLCHFGESIQEKTFHAHTPFFFIFTKIQPLYKCSFGTNKVMHASESYWSV